jgi:hypothetical protein
MAEPHRPASKRSKGFLEYAREGEHQLLSGGHERAIKAYIKALRAGSSDQHLVAAVHGQVRTRKHR